MNLQLNQAIFIGQQQRVSKNGNPYTTVLFAKDADTLQLMVKADDIPLQTKVQKLELYKPYNLSLDYNTRFKNLNLVDIAVKGYTVVE